MPMFQLPPGDQDHRILGIRPLVGRNDVGGHEFRSAGRRRKRLDEHHRIAGIAFLLAGIGDAVFLLQPLPGNTADARHGMSHLIEHSRHRLLSRAIRPREAKLARDIDDDLQILARLARRIECLASQLHISIGVGKGAGFLGKRGGRQNDVGKIGGFGQENILHHQHVELRQRLTCMIRIGIAHRGILAHDVHAFDIAGEDVFDDLDYRQAGLIVELVDRHVPGFREALDGLGVIDALIVRIHHGNESGVRSALHVVLSAQRVQPRSRSADLSRHQGQRDETAGIVGAVNVLTDPHAPENHGARAGCIQPRDFANGIRGNAANRRHQVRTVALHVLRQFRVPQRAVRDEFGVHQILLDDDMHHGVEQGHVGVGLELQEAIRGARQVAAARIHDDQLRACAHGILDEGRRHWMIHGGVGADYDDHRGLRDIHDRIADRSGADALEKRRDTRSVAKPRAVIDVVAAEA